MCFTYRHSIYVYMNTKHKGEISEAAVVLRFLETGKFVSKPVGENQKYDLLIDDGKKISRIQVKTAKVREGYLDASSSSTTLKDGKYTRTIYNDLDIDFFAVYSPELKKVYLVPVDTNGCRTTIRLRLEMPKNGQIQSIKWAKDFEV